MIIIYIYIYMSINELITQDNAQTTINNWIKMG
jgi:hypothetical protein